MKGSSSSRGKVAGGTSGSEGGSSAVLARASSTVRWPARLAALGSAMVLTDSERRDAESPLCWPASRQGGREAGQSQSQN